MGNKLVPGLSFSSPARGSRTNHDVVMFSEGEGEKKGKEFESIVEKCYDKHFEGPQKEEAPSMADFYRIVCETVEYVSSPPTLYFAILWSGLFCL